MWVAIVGSRTLGENCGCTDLIDGGVVGHPEDCPLMTAWLLVLQIVARSMKRPGFEGIVTGGARGADHLAEEAAKLSGIPCKVYRPSDEKGKTFAERAHQRNERVVKKADLIIALYDPRYPKSPGTTHALSVAARLGKEHHVWQGHWER